MFNILEYILSSITNTITTLAVSLIDYGDPEAEALLQRSHETSINESIARLKQGNVELEAIIRRYEASLALKARADELLNLQRLAERDPVGNALPFDFYMRVRRVEEDWEAVNGEHKKDDGKA